MSGNNDFQFLEGVKPNRFMIGIWALCAAVLLLDGYDLTVIALIVPELVKKFGFERSSIGLVFSIGLVGVALGSLLGGWIGDRHGRKVTITASCFVSGLATLAMLLAQTVPELAICRFAVGIGLGAALATAIALSAEFAPKEIRNRVMAVIGISVPLGAIIPGVLTATLVPTFGWRLLVVVGGALPVLLAIILLRVMPESIEYLALRPALHDRLSALLKRLYPDREGALISVAAPREKAGNASIGGLFADGLASITLSLWLLFFVNAMALYLMINWLPLVLQSLGMSLEQAGLVAAAFAAAGLIGSIIVASFIAWAGVAIVPSLFIIAVPSLLMFTAPDLSRTAIILCILLPGLAVGGIQVACSTVAGMLYPAGIRVTGVGWAVAMGRIGAILGPFFGNLVFALGLPPRQLFAFATAPMVLGAVGATVLSVLCHRRFGNLHVDDASRTGNFPRTARPRQVERMAILDVATGGAASPTNDDLPHS